MKKFVPQLPSLSRNNSSILFVKHTLCPFEAELIWSVQLVITAVREARTPISTGLMLAMECEVQKLLEAISRVGAALLEYSMMLS